VQILVRVRPFSDAELKLGSQSSVAVHSDKQLSLLPHSEATQYVFDHVLKGDTSQNVVFEGVSPIVASAHQRAAAAAVHCHSHISYPLQCAAAAAVIYLRG
jgi:hypothetical protein